MDRKANVGISNDKWREKRHRRKTKGSSIYVNQIRVSRVLRISREVKPMARGLIFLRLLCKESDASTWSLGTDGIVP